MRLRGRSQRGRSKASGCGASACSTEAPLTIYNHERAARRSCKDSATWDGRSDAASRSTTARTRHSSCAVELVALAPEVILAVGSSVVGPLLAATRTVPVVFVQVSDPLGAGFVLSLARPGGNATGFTLFEFGISAKWIELLKEVAPHVTRAAVLFDSSSPTGFGQLGAIQSVAPSLGVYESPQRQH